MGCYEMALDGLGKKEDGRLKYREKSHRGIQIGR
jgi:hypothetical protein